MAINKRLLVKPPSTGITPSEHFGVVLYEGDGTSSHSINGGKFGAGAYFDGSNGKIDIDRNVLVGNNWTISMWVRVASGTPYTNFRFYDSSYGDYAGKLRLGINTDGTVNVAQGNSTSAETSFSSTGTINDNAWHNLSVTFDGTTARLYIDGSADGTGTPSNYSDSSGDARIGGGNTISGSNPFKPCKGKIDQVRFFQKELSSSEVSTLYAETASTVESLDPLSEDTTDTLQVLGDSSCIAAYQFENDETDLSGNFNGTGTEIQYAAGRYGQAASFNGTASRISTSLDFDNYDENWSISYWVKFTFDTNYRAILGSCDASNLNGMVSDIGTSGEIRFRLRDATGSESALSSTGTYGDGNWHHVVCIKGSSSNHLYIDGELDSSTATTNGINHSALNLGTFGLSSTEFLKGELDQVRIFNKAISASEVTTLYNENSLVASYRFEGNANDDTRNYDGTASNVTYEYGLNFTPDLVWIKDRGTAEQHILNDSTRGASYDLSTNTTAAQANRTTGFLSFDTGGFTLGSDGGGVVNDPTRGPYVAWCFKANGGTTSSNTDGTNTSTVQVNSDAGFSIVQGTSSGGYPTVNSFGHGLGVTPAMIIIKQTNGIAGWPVWHQSFSNTAQDYLSLNLTNAKATSSEVWGNSAPTSSVFSITDGWTLNVGGTFIAYCFAEVEGFSKFGTYTGTGAAGNRIETGFEPAFVMIKSSSNVSDWYIIDNKRPGGSPSNKFLIANGAGSEYTTSEPDALQFYSNGFEVGSGGSFNNSGYTWIYLAFAADPDTEQPTVAKSFSTVAYDGTGSAQTIEGLGFSPSLVWIKNRAAANSHNIYDTVRGATKLIESDTSDAEVTSSTGLTAFTDDGFTVSTGSGVNNATGDYVAWAFKADDNEPAINTEGSIDSLVSANANAGFSIVKYEGNGSAGATIGHGLSAAPEMVIIKNLDSAVDWRVGHTSAGWTKFGKLNTTDAFSTSSVAWNDTAPSSTVVTLGTSSGLNSSGVNYIAYCFHSVSGFSKFGSYSGNNTSTSVTTGFQPDFVMLKRTTAIGNWNIWDSVRNGSSGSNDILYPNKSDVETDAGAGRYITFDSNGFTIYGDSGDSNANGHTYLYAAFKIN